jgi:hypothetical protein
MFLNRRIHGIGLKLGHGLATTYQFPSTPVNKLNQIPADFTTVKSHFISHNVPPSIKIFKFFR